MCLPTAVAPLNRPHAVGVLAAGGEHVGIAGLVGAIPARRQHPGAFVDDLDSR
jgi:hypothetical protein